MDYLRILWDDPSDPHGNVQHIEEHGLGIEEVEEVLESPCDEGISNSTGRPCCWGYTMEGIYLLVVYEIIEEATIRVVTAFEVPEPR